MKQTIRLFQTPHCWAVDWSNTTQAARIADLFGTPVVPTPFMPRVDGATVQAQIQTLNPEYIVARFDQAQTQAQIPATGGAR